MQGMSLHELVGEYLGSPGETYGTITARLTSAILEGFATNQEALDAADDAEDRQGIHNGTAFVTYTVEGEAVSADGVRQAVEFDNWLTLTAPRLAAQMQEQREAQSILNPDPLRWG